MCMQEREREREREIMHAESPRVSGIMDQEYLQHTYTVGKQRYTRN